MSKTEFRYAMIGCGAAGRAVLHVLRGKGSSKPCWLYDTAGGDALYGVPVLRELPSKPDVDVLLLAVPDDQIELVAQDTSTRWSSLLEGVFVAQLSGGSPLSKLEVLEKQGAFPGMLHPLMSFPARSSQEGRAQPVPNWALCGSASFCLELREMIESRGMSCFEVAEEEQIPYHLACVLSANFLPALLAKAVEIWPEKSRDNAIELLEPMLAQVLRNLTQSGIGEALSGPIVRGDRSTVMGHLDWLEDKKPELLQFYRIFQEAVLEIREPEGPASGSTLDVWLG